jgi:uncharacterized protein CbrC (UPF0167 family)
MQPQLFLMQPQPLLDLFDGKEVSLSAFCLPERFASGTTVLSRENLSSTLDLLASVREAFWATEQGFSEDNKAFFAMCKEFAKVSDVQAVELLIKEVTRTPGVAGFQGAFWNMAEKRCELRTSIHMNYQNRCFQALKSNSAVTKPPKLTATVQDKNNLRSKPVVTLKNTPSPAAAVNVPPALNPAKPLNAQFPQKHITVAKQASVCYDYFFFDNCAKASGHPHANPKAGAQARSFNHVCPLCADGSAHGYALCPKK